MSFQPQGPGRIFPLEPFPPGDPAPEIYSILREVLDHRQLLEVVNVLIEANLKAGEVRLEGMRSLQKLVAQGLERSG